MKLRDVMLATAALSLVLGCSSSSSDGGDKSGGNKAGDGGTPSGQSPSKGSAPTVSCPSGQTNIADKWYAVEDCRTYFDTAEKCTCAQQTDKAACADQFSKGLSSSLCAPQGMTFDEATYANACKQALSAYQQGNPSCK